MPELERKAIWGLMIGEEGKTKIPILHNYTEAGFDPEKDLLQSYGEGWQSGAFLPQERQLFGFPGGLMNDWHLRTNLEGLYAAGDQLFASNCHGHAAATGHYAGRHAARYADDASQPPVDEPQVDHERGRVFSLLDGEGAITWRHVNATIAQIMRDHCGAIKSDALLDSGLTMLQDLRTNDVPRMSSRNPHELVRSLEVLNVLTNAELVLFACLARKASAEYLLFDRSDYTEKDPPDWHRFVTVKLEGDAVKQGTKPIDYYGDLQAAYEAHNEDCIAEETP
jgi:succinate dehydrogenase/fumarate reductase flavoprotein subunit